LKQEFKVACVKNVGWNLESEGLSWNFLFLYFLFYILFYSRLEKSAVIINNASKKKIAQKINKDDVRRVYVTERRNALKKDAIAYYNTNIKGFNIYTFELNNNKVIQLALNEEMEKIVKIIYVQKMTR
jgi:Na+-transporting methylmalonyl-CoA/oxaloacetate decarboxylase gamma subunit